METVMCHVDTFTYTWIVRQRSYYKRGQLYPDRIKDYFVEKILSFAKYPHKTAWVNIDKILKDYKEEYL
jgi:hypothetical protein